MKRILFLSDLHIFSLWGLLRPGFEATDPRTGDIQPFVLNPTQERLWQHWTKMLNQIKREGEPDIIIINGDICEGPQKANMGQTVVNSNLDMQAAAAIDVLETLPKVPMFFTKGTGYHSVGTGTERDPIERHIANHFGAEYGDELLIDECGIRTYARHFISFSKVTWQYWTTPISRDILLLAVNKAEEKYGDVSLAGFSHAHYFASSLFTSCLAFVSPCWQTKTPYAVDKGIVTPPDIGWLTIHVKNKKAIMIDRSGITHLTYPCRVVGREARNHG